MDIAEGADSDIWVYEWQRDTMTRLTFGGKNFMQSVWSQPLLISEQTLRHRLHQRRLLATVDAGRQMLLVRRTLEGRPRQVLHLKASDLISN